MKAAIKREQSDVCISYAKREQVRCETSKVKIMIKIGLFIPCYVDAFFPEVGMATYKLLRHLDFDVTYPEQQTCCGQPMANAGFEKQAIPLA